MTKNKKMSIEELNDIVRSITDNWSRDIDLRINKETANVKISNCLAGIKLSPLHCARISLGREGLKRSEQSKAKQSLTRKNRKSCSDALASVREKTKK